MISINGNAKTVLDCNVHKIYCKIVELQPAVDKDWALKLSNLLYEKSKELSVDGIILDPFRSVAIAMQESSLQNSVRKTQVLLVSDSCHGLNNHHLVAKYNKTCVKTSKYVKGYTDIGVFQFHVGTIKGYGFDPLKLLYSLDYAVESHLLVLRDKMKTCKHLGKDSWSCYHSTTDSLRNKYVKMVNKYY